MAFLTLKVEAIKTLYPLDWIEAAFIKAAGQANHGHLAHYANSLLIAAWRKGRWEEPEEFEPRPPRSPSAPRAKPVATPEEKRAAEAEAKARRKAALDAQLEKINARR